MTHSIKMVVLAADDFAAVRVWGTEIKIKNQGKIKTHNFLISRLLVFNIQWLRGENVFTLHWHLWPPAAAT